MESSEWLKLRQRLQKEHSLSVMLIRSRMREVLGFTVRTHAKWVDKRSESAWEYDNKHHGYYRNEIHLDFYDEAMRSFFILKYMNTD